MYRYLGEDQVEQLQWADSPLKLPVELTGILYRIGVKGDGSCYFHSILRAFNATYINNPELRTSYTVAFRSELVPKLRKHYESLGDGNLKEFGDVSPEFSLAELSKLLNSMSAVGDSFRELISRELDINIFIVDILRRDLYVSGDNVSTMYSPRPSVVLLYLPGHYETVALKGKDSQLHGYFVWENQLIQALYRRSIENGGR